MISLIVSLLVLLVVIYVANLIVDALALPANIKQIVYIILALVFLVHLLQTLGIGSYYLK